MVKKRDRRSLLRGWWSNDDHSSEDLLWVFVFEMTLQDSTVEATLLRIDHHVGQ